MAIPNYQTFNEGKSAGGTTVVVTKPTGVVEGDLLIGVLVSDGKNETHFSPESDSWDDVLVNQTDGSALTVSIWQKKAEGSEPANYTFGCGSTEALYAFVIRIDGQHATTPIDTNSVAGTGSGISATCPDITTQYADELVLRIFGADHGDVTVDGGWASVNLISVDESDAGNGACSGGAGHEDQAGAGSTGTEINTLTAAEQWIGFTIGIRPPIGQTFYQNLDATTAPSASLVKATSKLTGMAASSTPSAGLVTACLFSQFLGATSAPLAGLSELPTFTELLETVTTPAIALTKKISKTLAATTTPTGALLKRTKKTLAATTIPVASLAKKMAITLAATTAPLAGLATDFTEEVRRGLKKIWHILR